MPDRYSSRRESSDEFLIGEWNLAESGGVEEVPGEPRIPDIAGRAWAAPLAVSFSLHSDETCLAVPQATRSAANASTWVQPKTTPRDPDAVEPEFPKPGQELGGFRLVSELGRGAFARVYLAEELLLAERQVALKVSEALGDEPQALARLQHAHIVPIHSVHDDPKSGYRLLCMPYLGGANLAQVLELAGHSHVSHTQGRSLVEALDQLAQDAPPTAHALVFPPSRSRNSMRTGWSRVLQGSRRPHAATRGIGAPTRVRSALARYLSRLAHPRSASMLACDEPIEPGAIPAEEQPARRFFRSNSFVRTTVWIIARLAEALEHAHARGLLHRDLKPSNILIAADGTPMLLDFNLSELAADAAAADAPRARVGGTLPYMAPEHIDAFNPKGKTHPSAVDERSDLYGLGLICYEMLAGHHPFPDPEPSLPIVDALDRMVADRARGAAPIRKINSSVPPSIESVLKKCLEFDPARRYASAGELAEDLRRFLDNRPMKFAPEPSVRERVSKWLRRHPEARSTSTVGALAAGLLLVLGMVAWSISGQLEGAAAVLTRGQFASNFQRVQLLLNTSNGPRTHLPEGLKLADATLASYGLSPVRLPRGWHDRPNVRRLEFGDRQVLLEELSELLMLRARAEVRLASTREPNARRQAYDEAYQSLILAESIDPNPPASLFFDRAAYARGLGQTDIARQDEARAAAKGVRGARDCHLFGLALAAAGRNEEAIRYLTRAVALDERRFWDWFVLGMCHYDQGQYVESAADFSICSIINPKFSWPYLNRGLALVALGRWDEAKTAYDRAIELAPKFVEAYVNRAMLHLQREQTGAALRDLDFAMRCEPENSAYRAVYADALHRAGRPHEAEAVLNEAISKSPRDPSLLVARGLLFLKAGDSARATRDLSNVLEFDPQHARALLGLAHVTRAQDPRRALELLDRSLEAEPSLPEAHELRALLRARKGDPRALEDVESLLKQPSPTQLYNASCALSILASRTKDSALLSRAGGLLKQALQRGFSRAHAVNDPDLTPLRDQPEFAELLRGPV